MSKEQPTATIRCPRCDGTGLVLDKFNGKQVTCFKCLGHCYVMNTPGEEPLVEKMVSAACDAQEQFTEDELEQHASKCKRKIQAVMPVWMLVFALIFGNAIMSCIGCTSTADTNDVLIMNHLKSFKQGDIIKMDGQPNYKFTIQDCYDIGYGKPSTHAIVYHIDELGMLHQDLVDLRVCTHAE